MSGDRRTALAARLEALVEEAVASRIAEAREEGYRAGLTDGRREARIEMNERLRALIYDPSDHAFVPKATDSLPAAPSLPAHPSAGTPPETPPEVHSAPPEDGAHQPPATQPISVAADDDPGEARPAPQAPADWRTDARRDELSKRYRLGEDMTVIRLALSELPGPSMPSRNALLWSWVQLLKLRRDDAPPPAFPPPAPPAVRPAASHPSIAPPAPRPGGANPLAASVALPPPREDGKIYASFAEVRAWAGAYGIAYDGSNMDRVNKARAAKGLPPLVQEGA